MSDTTIEIGAGMEMVAAKDMAVAKASGMPELADVVRAVMQGGVTNDNAATMEKMMALLERIEEKAAEKAFAAEFVELQKEIPKVQATKVVPTKEGGAKYSFAPIEEIDKQARPICLKHGFTYSFSEAASEPGKLTKVCVLQHVGGHKRSNPYTVRIGKGPPGCSESQADGAAHSYAKRGALCDALNIIVSQMDNDARIEGGPVTAEQAFELERRVSETNSDRAIFLKFSGATTFRDISASKYDMLDQLLAKKERRKP